MSNVPKRPLILWPYVMWKVEIKVLPKKKKRLFFLKYLKGKQTNFFEMKGVHNK